MASERRFIDLLEIQQLLPHRGRALGLDRAWCPTDRPLVYYGQRLVTEADCCGHFGVLPGVLLIDWCTQLTLLGGRLLGGSEPYGLLNSVCATEPLLPLLVGDIVVMRVNFLESPVSTVTKTRPRGQATAVVALNGTEMMRIELTYTAVDEAMLVRLRSDALRKRLLRRSAGRYPDLLLNPI